MEARKRWAAEPKVTKALSAVLGLAAIAVTILGVIEIIRYEPPPPTEPTPPIVVERPAPIRTLEEQQRRDIARRERLQEIRRSREAATAKMREREAAIAAGRCIEGRVIVKKGNEWIDLGVC